MKRILLINPDYETNKKCHIDKKNYSRYPSIGLGYIAAVLEKEGHHVKYLDMVAFKITLANLERMLSKGRFSDYDYIGMTATTPIIKTAHKIAALFKKYVDGVEIIVGGVHAATLPQEVLADKNIDYVIRGDGELIMKEIVNGMAKNKILGVSYRDKKGKVMNNKLGPMIDDLDDLPFPAYHLMPIHKYYPSPGSYKRLPAISMIVTRGCHGRCTFCNPWTQGKVRSHSARRIVDEIKYLIKNYGIKEVGFFDDYFTADKKNINEFCNMIIKERVDVTWSCFTRVNCVEKRLFRMMKKAGCHSVLFGIESGSQELLNKMKKGTTIEQAKNAVKICKKLGLQTRASYMFGVIGETRRTLKMTMKLAFELDTDHAIFSIMTPYPGTEVWKEAKDNGWIANEDYNDYIGEFVTLGLPSVSMEEVQSAYDQAYRKYYLRPKIILRNLLRMNNRYTFKQNLDGIKGLIFNK